MRSMDFNEDNVGCIYCLKKYECNTDANHHKMLHRKTLLKCEQCKFETHFKSYLRIHMKKHSPDTLNAEICEDVEDEMDLTFSRLCNLNDFQVKVERKDLPRKKLSKKSYLICYTSGKNQLKNHLRYNSKGKNYKSSILKRKLYKCICCSYVTGRKSNMIKHLKEDCNLNDLSTKVLEAIQSDSLQVKIKKKKKYREAKKVKFYSSSQHSLIKGKKGEVHTSIANNVSKKLLDNNNLTKRRKHIPRSKWSEYWNLPGKRSIYPLKISDMNTLIPAGLNMDKSKVKESILYNVIAQGKDFSSFETTYNGKTNINKDAKRQYKCVCCSFRTSEEASILNHVSIHSEQKTMFARDGLHMEKSPSKESIQHHSSAQSNSFKNAHNGKSDIDGEIKRVYRCSLCSFETSEETIILTHVKIHSEPALRFRPIFPKPPETFNICPRVIPAETVDPDHKELIQIYKCSNCDFSTVKKKRLNEHLKQKCSEYTGKKKTACLIFKCSKCGYSTSQRRLMTKHTKTKECEKPQEEPSDTRLDNEGIFECNFCEYTTTRSYDLNAHLNLKKCSQKFGYDPNRIQKENGLYKCKKCDYVTPKKGNLNTHMRTKKCFQLEGLVSKCTDKTMKQCPHCDFQTVYSLNTHILKFHNMIRPFKCDQCDYSAKIMWNLKQHRRKHYDEAYLSCSQCNFKTHIKEYFNLHLKRHLEGDKYLCESCGFKTYRKDMLKRHMNTHKEIDPDQKVHKCPQCDYTTAFKYHLNKHMRRNKKCNKWGNFKQPEPVPELRQPYENPINSNNNSIMNEPSSSAEITTMTNVRPNKDLMNIGMPDISSGVPTQHPHPNIPMLLYQQPRYHPHW